MPHTVVGTTDENPMPGHRCAPTVEGNYNIGDLVQCDVCMKLWVITRYTFDEDALKTMWYKEAAWSEKHKARKIARKAARKTPDITLGKG